MAQLTDAAVKSDLINEKSSSSISGTQEDVAALESQTTYTSKPKAWLSYLGDMGVEMRGVTPVPLEERVDKRFINIFFVWFTMSTNLLPIITGMVGTMIFGIGLRDCSLLILFFSLVCTVPAAYFSTFGSRTGLRQMLHARYTFGYWLVSPITALNLCTIAGFGIIDCVLGGSTLSAVSAGKIDVTAGVAIIALVSMVVCFGGIKFLHQFERYSWIYALLAIIITAGVGGKHLADQAVKPPAAPATLVGFGGVVAGFLIPWAVSRSLLGFLCFFFFLFFFW